MWEYKALILRVIDGDTYEAMVDCGFNSFRAITIRLNKYDTWEKRGEEREKGLAAKVRVEKLFEMSKNEVVIKTHRDPKQGSFGRWLADISIPGIATDLGATLFKEGHAVLWGEKMAQKQIPDWIVKSRLELREKVVEAAKRLSMPCPTVTEVGTWAKMIEELDKATKALVAHEIEYNDQYEGMEDVG